MSAPNRLLRHGGMAVTIVIGTLVACESSTGPVGRGPFGIPLLEVGQVRTGSVTPGGTNSFLIVGPADTALRIFLRATSGSATDSLVAEVGTFAPSGFVDAYATSVGNDPSLDEQATPTFRLEEGDTLLVTVRARGADDEGPYSIVLRTPNPSPEHAPAALVPGDTLTGEAIDVYGDIDEFTFTGAKDDVVLVYLRAASGNESDLLRVRLADPHGSELRAIHSSGDDAELTTQGTFPLTLPSSGTYRVVVHGANSPWDLDDTGSGRGPYALLVHRVNHAPELGSAAVAVGDTTAGSIEVVGDVDEFTFDAQIGEQIELNLQLIEGFTKADGYRGVAGGLFAELWAGNTRLALIGALTPAADLDQIGSGRITLPATRSYTVRFFGHHVGTRSGATGRYGFELYGVNPAPERADASIALSDTVFDERIERPADVDEFRFTAAAEEQIAVFLAAPEASGTVPLMVELVDPAGLSVGSGNSVTGYEGGTYVGGGGVRRRTLATSGPYTARVTGAPWARQDVYPAPYTLEVYRVDLAPETVSADLHAGDVVTAERIDRIADVDRFRLHGTEGDEINIFLRPSGQELPVVLLFDAWFPVTGWDGVSGRMRLSRTGEFPIEVFADLGGTARPGAGAYELELYRIDRAPESVPATYVVGDTIRAERLDRIGDIDEYTFTATAGERLRFVCEAREGGVPRSIYCLVADEQSGSGVSGVSANRPEEERTWGDFTVQVTGVYRVQIVGANDGRSTTEFGEYQFGLERIP